MVSLSIIWYIGIGGFFGAISRFGLSNSIAVGETGFFWATFTVNIIGSFLLGLILSLVTGKMPISEKVKTLITTGFISSFTTFSTFSNEILSLLEAGKFNMALIYMLANVVFGLLLCLLGVFMGKELTVRRNSQAGGEQ